MPSPRSTRGLPPGVSVDLPPRHRTPRRVERRTGFRALAAMADVFYRAPGADSFDLWSGDSYDPREVHMAYEAMSREERDIAAARRRAAAHADARRYDPRRFRRPTSGSLSSPYGGSPETTRWSPDEARRCHAAATRIQKIWRGASDRSVATDRWVAVFQIQRFWRGALGRRRARAARRDKRARDEAEARAEEMDAVAERLRQRRRERKHALVTSSPEMSLEGERQPDSSFARAKRIDWNFEPIESDETSPSTRSRWPRREFAAAADAADAPFSGSPFSGSPFSRRRGWDPVSAAPAMENDEDDEDDDDEDARAVHTDRSYHSERSGGFVQTRSLLDDADSAIRNSRLARNRLLKSVSVSPESRDSRRSRVSSLDGGSFEDRSRFFAHDFAALASRAASVADGDALEKRESASRGAAAIAAAIAAAPRDGTATTVAKNHRDDDSYRIRTELLPPMRPVSARRVSEWKAATSKKKKSENTATYAEPSPRSSARLADHGDPSPQSAAAIKARYEAVRLEEDRAFAEKLKTLQREEREANARAAAAAAAETAETLREDAAVRGVRTSSPRAPSFEARFESFPSLDDTAGSFGDLDLGVGFRSSPTVRRNGASVARETPSPRSSFRPSPKRASSKSPPLPLWDGFS